MTVVERRSAGADALPVFENTLDRLLAGRAEDVQERVLDAVRDGASTANAIAEVTGLSLPIVERSIAALVASGRVATRTTARRPRKAIPRQSPDDAAPKAATG